MSLDTGEVQVKGDIVGTIPQVYTFTGANLLFTLIQPCRIENLYSFHFER